MLSSIYTTQKPCNSEQTHTATLYIAAMAIVQELATWRGAAVASACVLIGWIALGLVGKRHSDPREPPRAPHPIPVFGHMLSYIIRGSVYLQRVCESSGQTLLTLPLMPNFSMYLVGDAETVRLIHRHSGTLVFDDMANMVVQRMTGVEKAVYDIGPKGDAMREMHRIHQTTMLPGPKMREMLDRVYLALGKRWAEIDDESGKVGKLEGIVRWFMTEAGAKGMFGNDNPITHSPEMVEMLR